MTLAAVPAPHASRKRAARDEARMRRAAHVIQRAAERYGVVLSTFDVGALAGAVRASDGRSARLMCRQKGGRSIWLVRHGSVWMVAAVAEGRGAGVRIVTLLPAGTQFDDETGEVLSEWRRGEGWVRAEGPGEKRRRLRAGSKGG